MAIKNALKVAECGISEELKNFLESNLVSSKKKKKNNCLALLDNRLAGAIATELNIECKTSDVIFELFRGIRMHFIKFLKNEGF